MALLYVGVFTLGGFFGVLGVSWRRLDGVLGRLGELGNAEERLTMLACV